LQQLVLPLPLFRAICLDLTSLLRRDAPVLFTSWNKPLSLLEFGVDVKSGVEAKLGLAESSDWKLLTTFTKSESLPKVLMTLIFFGLGVVGTTMEEFDEFGGLGSFRSIDKTFVAMFCIIF
jgi:hypothetical protein